VRHHCRIPSFPVANQSPPIALRNCLFGEAYEEDRARGRCHEGQVTQERPELAQASESTVRACPPADAALERGGRWNLRIRGRPAHDALGAH
jgi:hypothetical protein